MSLDLSRYTSEYRKKGDIVNAVAWSTVKRYLESVGIGDIFEHIKSINIDTTKKSITIKTGKGIYNSELVMRKEDILQECNTSLSHWGIKLKDCNIR